MGAVRDISAPVQCELMQFLHVYWHDTETYLDCGCAAGCQGCVLQRRGIAELGLPSDSRGLWWASVHVVHQTKWGCPPYTWHPAWPLPLSLPGETVTALEHTAGFYLQALCIIPDVSPSQ
jgi:hypothetical protein